jgi:hypothetical protein
VWTCSAIFAGDNLLKGRGVDDASVDDEDPMLGSIGTEPTAA